MTRLLSAFRLGLLFAAVAVLLANVLLGISVEWLFALVLLVAAASSALDLVAKIRAGEPRRNYYVDIVFVAALTPLAIAVFTGLL